MLCSSIALTNSNSSASVALPSLALASPMLAEACAGDKERLDGEPLLVAFDCRSVSPLRARRRASCDTSCFVQVRLVPVKAGSGWKVEHF